MRDTDSKVDLEAAIATVSDRLQAGEEWTVRRFSVVITKGHQSAAPDHRPAAILCLRSLVNSETVDRFILQPLLANPVVGQSGLEDAIANESAITSNPAWKADHEKMKDQSTPSLEDLA